MMTRASAAAITTTMTAATPITIQRKLSMGVSFQPHDGNAIGAQNVSDCGLLAIYHGVELVAEMGVALANAYRNCETKAQWRKTSGLPERRDFERRWRFLGKITAQGSPDSASDAQNQIGR